MISAAVQDHITAKLTTMSSDKCPVDHSQRAKWMEKMKAAPPSPPEPPAADAAASAVAACPVDPSARAQWLGAVSVATQAPDAVELAAGCSSDTLPDTPRHASAAALPVEREISSIPRTDTRAPWIYPSQKQFYEAMMRKNWAPEAADMQTVVPIHNQVNELAWRNILQWERAYAEQTRAQCGGVSLTSFRGDSTRLTPRAWFRSAVLGLDRPFDRHDWMVDRCGVAVPYVIDFYSGADGVLVDARPRLDSWAGLKLRVGRAFGLL